MQLNDANGSCSQADTPVLRHLKSAGTRLIPCGGLDRASQETLQAVPASLEGTNLLSFVNHGPLPHPVRQLHAGSKGFQVGLSLLVASVNA